MKRVVSIILALVICVVVSEEAFPVDISLGGRIKKPVKSFREIKTQNIVKQSFDYSCGPASLATLFSYFFSDTVTEDEIIKGLLITVDLEKIKERKGFSLLDLKNYAKMRGYEVVGYKMDLEYLVSLNKPVLVPINIKDYSHFIIFRGLIGDRVFLADPALGNMTMRVEKFLNLWQNGIGLVLSKADNQNPNAPLKLTEEEKAVFADPSMVGRTFGVDTLGNVHADGEFR
ncbi:MAG: C39 family peptidase [Candidatus Omnitrophica bacterium]|nr:C39 family peptidase [Candidatus Omnitrophota bacterium]MBU1852938.1 C39 family peptidase [Candidatus Omnitrophota bacterium]